MPKNQREKPTKPGKDGKQGFKSKTGVKGAPDSLEGGFGSQLGNETYEKVISVNRCSKVVKGGKRFSFAALVVVGNGQGEGGFAIGKAKEVAEAIRKGTTRARKNLFKVPIKGMTIPHEVIGHFGAGKVIMKPAAPGTGIIAGGAVRALCHAVGIKDILTKSLGTSNAINVIRASVDGFQHLMTHQHQSKIESAEVK